VAIGVLGAGQAQALLVNVGGQQWNVTTFREKFIAGSATSTKFNTSANGGTMPWFGNLSLASQFASAIGFQFDLPNCVGDVCGPPGRGPFFAFRGNNSNPSLITSYNVAAIRQDGSIGDGTFYSTNGSETFTWAQADLVPPVPGPLPALGAAAAFGLSRKLRKRIKDSKAVGGSITVD
jgi:hypothetical protein